MRSKNKTNPAKYIVLIVLIILIVVLIRMILIIQKRSALATERLNSAQAELTEINELIYEIEGEVESINSVDGRQNVLRDRYGVVGENEGFIILTDEYPEDEIDEGSRWWQVWE
mgnify:CR=1 FL=1